MLIVYRIQDCDGRGPYKPGFSKLWVEDRPEHENMQPWFIEFGSLEDRFLYGEVIGCACKTIEQLRRWFTKKEYRKLRNFGYEAVKMQVNRIIAESNIQCVIGRTKPLNKKIEIVKLW